MALPDVHIQIPLSPPQLIVCVCVCSMATCFQNAQFSRKSCYAYVFITSEMAHRMLLPPSTLPHVTTSAVQEGCDRLQSVEVTRSSTAHQLLRGAWEEPRTGAFQLYSFAPRVLIGCCDIWQTKQPWCESPVMSGPTMMTLPVFAKSKLCSRPSRHLSLDVGNDTSQWNGHRQAEGRSIL